MSEKTGVGACCLGGAIHSAVHPAAPTPSAVSRTYVSEPANHARATSIVFLVDPINRIPPFPSRLIPSLQFGEKLPIVRHLADFYACADFHPYIPNIQLRDAVPLDFLRNIELSLKVQENWFLFDKAKIASVVKNNR